MSHPCALVSTLQRAIAPTSQRQRACMKVLCRQCVRLATPQVSRVLHVSCTFLHSRVMKKKKTYREILALRGIFGEAHGPCGSGSMALGSVNGEPRYNLENHHCESQSRTAESA